MTETPTVTEQECFCYQPFHRIWKKLTETLYERGLTERLPEEEAKSQCIYLYSPFGGIGVSGLAYELAMDFAKKEKVLLLSFDAYHNFENEFIAFRLSDFLFYWETVKEVNIQDFCHKKGNLHILHGPRDPEDLSVLKAKKKEDLLRLLASGEYSKIIFDLSSSTMQFWCRPQEKREIYFVVKRLAEKWKQFSAAADFNYIAVSESNAGKEIQEALRGQEIC